MRVWAEEPGHGPRDAHQVLPVERLQPDLRSHLESCERCRAFAAELQSLWTLCKIAGIEATPDMETIARAVEAGMRSTGTGRPRRRPVLGPVAEKLGFVALATLGLACHGVLLSQLGLQGFISFHLAAYSLMPLVFYVIFRLDARADAREG
ncbi:MAG: hypothetical protein AB1700_01425 [Bacillota bacterium]